MYFILNHWPLWFISLAMVAAAVIDGWKLKVPNWLTFPLVLSGWALGVLHMFGLFTSATGAGDVWASLAGTALGFILLFPVYAVGGMGAGDVKMQMGFGAWVGAFYGFASGLWIIFCAFCLAVVIGGLIATAMILARGKYRENVANTRAIVADLFKGPGAAAENAAKRKPRMQLLPYGIPLCLGFLSFLLYYHW
ncbi:MAG TPA: A24 family peptidase [Gemmataceae bacterium]|nr:A24 family peptidase [Gemmataceae bacterium]